MRALRLALQSRRSTPSLAAVALLLVALAGSTPAQPPPGAEPVAAPSLEQLDKQEFDLGRALESVRLDLASAERRFARAQERLEEKAQADAALREEVAARRLQLSTAQRAASLLEARIERVRGERVAVQRLEHLRGERVAPEALADWRGQADDELDRLVRELTVKRARRDELRQELEFTRQRVEQLGPGSAEARWVGAQARALAELVDRYEEDLADLAGAEAVARELIGTLERESRELSLSARLRAFLHELRAVWNYHLAGPELEPITPGKIAGAVVIFLIGYLLAGFVSRLLGRRVFPRMRLEPGAAQAFQSLAFYLLMLVAFLTALRMVQIPLAAFAVVGGALAIGVGFGSQTVVNNFISGLILLAERPIKLGDLIEVEGVYGTVERIGLRSTRIRTGDNIHIIVPNAAFLERNVVNWTHTDPRVRVQISVGVAYGSPTREVARLIRRALEEHPQVLSEPEPAVLFRDFGDSALVFDARFWIEMRSMMDRMRAESDTRFRIDDLFREAGIVIAFPQRDVHLDTSEPLQVRLSETPERTDAA